MRDSLAAIREYHERTKHYPGVSNAARRVDAALVPKQYKRYLDLPFIELPTQSRSERSLFETLEPAASEVKRLTLSKLAAVLHYSAGIVRRRRVGGREMAFRAASCTGALYHIEAYVVCGDIDGDLAAGVYHFDVPANALRPLREGDYRHALSAACCDEGIESAPASVVLTSTFWRNAWRYEERAYRHVFWDGGTVLANLLAIAEGYNLQPSLRTAFIDSEVNALLGVDGRREAAVAAVTLGAGDAGSERPAVTPLKLGAEPLSRAEIEYPLIWHTHGASSFTGCDEVRAWREAAQGDASTSKGGDPLPRQWGRDIPALDASSMEDVIERRVSARRFAETPVSRDALEAVLDAARGSFRSDSGRTRALVEAMLIVNRVEGLASGIYRVGSDGGLSIVRAGDVSAEASHLALDQEAAGLAAVNLYLVASQAEVAAALGERGYRSVQLEAGMRVGRVYLAAASLGLRATGLTFYDDEVARSFGLDPEDALVLMVVVLGV